MCICRFFWRNTLGYRFVSLSSVRCCKDYITEVYMTGSRQHIYAVFSALHVRTSCNGASVKLKDVLHDVVCIIIIIAVFRALVMNHAVDCIVSLIVMLHCLDQLFHSEILIVVYIIFDSSGTVGNSSDTYTLDIVGVVSCPASIVILCIGDTVICYDRQARSRHLLSIQLLDYVVSADLNVYDIFKLFLKCSPQLVKGLKVFCISQLQTNLLSTVLIISVKQCQLEHLRDIQISCQNVSFASPCSSLHTSGRTAASCILQSLSSIYQLHDLSLCVIECRLSPSFSGNLACSL